MMKTRSMAETLGVVLMALLIGIVLNQTAVRIRAEDEAPVSAEPAPPPAAAMAGDAASAEPSAEAAAEEPAAPATEATAVDTPAAEAVVGAEEPAPAPAAGGERLDLDRQASPPQGTLLVSSNLINVAVENETLENVVAMFTRISGANIVATSANLDGLVTVNLQGVEWRPALSAILEVHDLALVEKMPGSGVYSIVPKPPERADPLVVETLFLNYTTVAEVKPVVTPMLAAVTNATVMDFPARNAMVVRTTEPNMREIRTLVEAMDQPGKQVCVEAKFMELSDQAGKALGLDWKMLGDNTPGGDPGIVLGASNLKLAYDQANRAYEIDGRGRIGGQSRTWSDLRTETEGAGSSVEDGAASSSSSEGYTRSVMEGAGQSDYQTYFNGKNIWGIDVDDEGKVTMTVPDKDSLTYSREILRSAVLSANQLNVVLNALKTTEGISIISNPKIIVASGSTNAYFKVGDREPMVRQETILGTTENQRDRTIAQLDTSISTDFIKGGYLETGISLQVVPVVKTENMIEAIILPRLVRRLLPDKEVAGNSWPRISVKEITTKFTLQSGQTVAIGGLTDTSDTKNVSKIPLLGDIPLIGKYLFSHTKDMKKQVETVVLVTLSLAEPERLAAGIGIPDNATLVHKKLIQAKSERRRFEQDLEKLKAASEAEGSEAQP